MAPRLAMSQVALVTSMLSSGLFTNSEIATAAGVDVEPVYQVLCDLSKDLTPREVVARKILAINLIIALSCRQELQTHKPRSTRAFLSALKQQTLSPPPPLPKFPVVLTERVVCHYPVCMSRGIVLNNVEHFKSHVQKEHRIKLREPRNLPEIPYYLGHQNRIQNFQQSLVDDFSWTPRNPIVEPEPEPEPASDDFGWGSISTSKKKKKGKR
ncbi:hypothetical protein BJ875DRAFT_517910 [Amylocarpus encephaloides]|uniref:Uncharacterized protein n=1 Tax=Amylocarpus encephaloides TaxID=45428 RepID=A0A9P7YDT8_9HELO|nr:hypothetical protein BJ875DRAFT_517910 [Amylocarpus encephaloides]